MNDRTRSILTFILLVVFFVALLFAPSQDIQQAHVAVQNLNATSPMEAQTNNVLASFPVRNILLIGSVLLILLTWLPVILRKVGIAGMVIPLILLAACQAKPANFIEVAANETAFVVDMNAGGTSDQSQTHSIDYWKKAQKIGVYRVPITLDQYNNPIQKVIKVSRAPVNVIWAMVPEESTDKAYLAPRFQTNDSQGFRLPLKLTAMIDEVPTTITVIKTDDAGKVTTDEITTGAAPAYEYYFGDTPLAEVLNKVVQSKITGILYDGFLSESTASADGASGKLVIATYNEIARFYAPMGITITGLSATDGLNWDSPDIQKAKDDRALAIQGQAIAAQNATKTSIENNTNAQSTQMAVQGQATQQYIAAQANIVQAGAYATATTIAGNTAAGVLEQQGKVLEANPGIIAYTQAMKWDGHLPPSYGGVQTYMQIPAPMANEATPAP